MKRFILPAVATALLLSLAACGGVANTPEAVSLAFAQSFDKMEFDAATKLGTDKTKEALEKMKTLMASNEDAKKEAGKGKFEKSTCTGTDKEKTCEVCCTEAGKPRKFKVVMDDAGKWKVDMTKEELSKEDNPMEGLENSLDSLANSGVMDSLNVSLDSLNETLEKTGK